MKSLKLFYVMLLILFSFSCRNTKNITMFQDITGDMSFEGNQGRSPEYIIKPYDNLYINILTMDPEVNQIFNITAGGTSSGTYQNYGDQTSQYINGYMVGRDGSIVLPVIGVVNLVGLNLDEAKTSIKVRAEEFLKEPVVKVKVLNFKVNVTGEVRSPGLYYNYDGNLNILDAISRAGGITEFADLNKVLVIRSQQNKSKTFSLNLTNKSVYNSEAFYLQPNDLIYIKPDKNKRMRENTSTYSLFLSTVSTLLVIFTLLNK